MCAIRIWPNERPYDIGIIGGGPGGMWRPSTPTNAERVYFIEKQRVAGTCLNRADPSKAMWGCRLYRDAVSGAYALRPTARFA